MPGVTNEDNNSVQGACATYNGADGRHGVSLAPRSSLRERGA